MGFDFVPAPAPPPSGGNFAKLPQFVGKLIVVVPYEKTLSKFKDDNGKPQEQTRSTVIAVQAGSHTNADSGEETTWEAGEVFDIFVSQKKVQGQTKVIGEPVLGRLLKEGKAWVLQAPTEADIALAKKVLADVEIPDKTSSKSNDDTAEVPW